MPDRLLIRLGLLFLMVAAPACAPSPDNPNQSDDGDLRRRCGNGVCGAREDCNSCPQDCGVCTTEDAGPPACTPTTCADQSKNCGDIPDGCGGTLTCGTCSGSQTCGGSGVANVCGGGTSAGYPRTIGWLEGIGFNELPSQLDNIAYYHLRGLRLDVNYDGVPDNFANNFATRMSSTDYSAYLNDVKQKIANAAARGITDNFLGVFVDSYNPNKPADRQYAFDFFDPSDIALMKKVFLTEAQFCKAAGITGIWIDAEPYDWPYLWRNEGDAQSLAAGHTLAEVKKAYFDAGVAAMQQMLSAYPNIQVLVSPQVPEAEEEYLHFPDFWAGLTAALTAANAPNGLVIADEWGYGEVNTSFLATTDDIEMGLDNSAPYGGERTALTYFDQLLGTKTWDWHLAHTTVGQVNSPYNPFNGDPLHSDDENAAAIRAEYMNTEYVRKYTWIYDERGAFATAPYANPVTCTFAGSTYQSHLPCGGEMLHRVLPMP